jgi:hypothetical protein
MHRGPHESSERDALTTIYPPARWREVSGQANDPPIRPIGVILHVDGDNSGSLFGYFNGKSGGVESHLFIRQDGGIEQYRDLDHEADANYLGNSWLDGGVRVGFLSVETQGFAEGEWTAEQLAEIKAFLLWASARYNFPLRVAPTYRSPGVGYHVMFGAGLGTRSWSNARGKVCPGPDRIRQFHDVIVPWMADPQPPTEGDDIMAGLTEDQLRKIIREEATASVQAQVPAIATAVWTRFKGRAADGTLVPVMDALNAVYRWVKAQPAPQPPAEGTGK